MSPPEHMHSQASSASIYAGDASIIADYCKSDVVVQHSNLKPSVPLSEPVNLQQEQGELSRLKRQREPERESDPSDPSLPPKRPKHDQNTVNSAHIPDTPGPSDGRGFYIIAHCPRSQAIMTRVKLPQGARFELARLISINKITTQELTKERIEAIKGTNAEAIREIERIYLNSGHHKGNPSMDKAFAKEARVNSPWSELDQEELALSKGPYEGLGNNPSNPGWYGGKIQFRGHLVLVDTDKTTKQESIKLVLDKCLLGSSCRFTRRFGSWSFIRVKIPSQLYYSKRHRLDIFFRQGFILWDRVFRACYAKGDNVFLFMTNEKLHSSSESATFNGGLSLEGFINWHNPLRYNTKQLMTKWASRMVLGFSTSIPGPCIEQEYILQEEDVVSCENSDMTDGCGLSSRMVHQLILEQLELDILPSAFQFRLAGCKGMSLLREDSPLAHCSDEEKKLKVWVRPSQTKIRYDPSEPLDPAMCTIDLLRTPHMRPAKSLSKDVVINLAENGVPHELFVNLLQMSLEDMVNNLSTWDGPDAMFNLWSNVERAGGVIAGRRAREARGEARVRGYTNYTTEELEQDPEENDEDGLCPGPKEKRSLAWWMDPISGSPSTLEETALELIDSGFHPQTSPILREKLKQIVTTKLDFRTRALQFDVAQSCAAFAVPDPYGCLGPDEIQIKSSSRNLRLEDGSLTDIILGPVLVGRDPCKSPCDIRKAVNAVERHALRNFVNVIVFSVQGYRRLIDFLAGGDYDGDIVFVIWLVSIVSTFQNADEALYGKEPDGLDICFLRDTETVGSFVERAQSMQPANRVDTMQTYLLGGLSDPSMIGKYSTMHDNSIYSNGYFSYRTRKLAAKFCRVLDAPKTGWRIKEETFEDDRRKYSNSEGPEWKSWVKGNSKKSAGGVFSSGSNLPYEKRDIKKMGKFIMDILCSKAKEEKDRLQKIIDKRFQPLPRALDHDLIEPWLSAQEWAQRGTSPDLVEMKKADLKRIAMHVEDAYRKHKQAKGHQQGRSFTEKSIESRQDMLRERSREFHAGPALHQLPTIPDEQTLNRYRASYAYKHDHDSSSAKWSRFPWDVAMGQLCAIKANALGPFKVVTRDFYEQYRMIKTH